MAATPPAPAPARPTSQRDKLSKTLAGGFQTLMAKQKRLKQEMKAAAEKLTHKGKEDESGLTHAKPVLRNLASTCKLKLGSRGPYLTRTVTALGVPSDLMGVYRWFRMQQEDLTLIVANTSGRYTPSVDDLGLCVCVQWVPADELQQSGCSPSNFVEHGPIKLEPSTWAYSQELLHRAQSAEGALFMVSPAEHAETQLSLRVTSKAIEVRAYNPVSPTTGELQWSGQMAQNLEIELVENDSQSEFKISTDSNTPFCSHAESRWVREMLALTVRLLTVINSCDTPEVMKALREENRLLSQQLRLLLETQHEKEEDNAIQRSFLRSERDRLLLENKDLQEEVSALKAARQVLETSSTKLSEDLESQQKLRLSLEEDLAAQRKLCRELSEEAERNSKAAIELPKVKQELSVLQKTHKEVRSELQDRSQELKEVRKFVEETGIKSSTFIELKARAEEEARKALHREEEAKKAKEEAILHKTELKAIFSSCGVDSVEGVRSILKQHHALGQECAALKAERSERLAKEQSLGAQVESLSMDVAALKEKLDQAEQAVASSQSAELQSSSQLNFWKKKAESLSKSMQKLLRENNRNHSSPSPAFSKHGRVSDGGCMAVSDEERSLLQQRIARLEEEKKDALRSIDAYRLALDQQISMRRQLHESNLKLAAGRWTRSTTEVKTDEMQKLANHLSQTLKEKDMQIDSLRERIKLLEAQLDSRGIANQPTMIWVTRQNNGSALKKSGAGVAKE